MVHSVLETTPDSVLHTDQDPLFEGVYSSSVSYFGHGHTHTHDHVLDQTATLSLT